MIFDSSHFLRLGYPACEIAAEEANKLVEARGYVVFGEAFSDGEMDNFKTDKAFSDTHVAFLIGIKPMGNAEPKEKPSMVVTTDKDAEMEALRKLNAQLAGAANARKAQEASNEQNG